MKCTNLKFTLHWVLTYIYLCNAKPHQDIKYDRHPGKFLMLFPSLCSHFQRLQWCDLFHRFALPLLELHIKRIIQYVLFCVCIFPLSIVLLRFIHLWCQKFVPSYRWVVIHYRICHGVLVSCWWTPWAVTNKAAKNILIHPFRHALSVIMVKCLGVELLGHRLDVFHFIRNWHFFPK